MEATEFDWKGVLAGFGALFLMIQGWTDRKRRRAREAKLETAASGTKAEVVSAEHKVIAEKIDAARDEVVDLIRGPRGILDCMDKLKDKIE